VIQTADADPQKQKVWGAAKSVATAGAAEATVILIAALLVKLGEEAQLVGAVGPVAHAGGQGDEIQLRSGPQSRSMGAGLSAVEHREPHADENSLEKRPPAFE